MRGEVRGGFLELCVLGGVCGERAFGEGWQQLFPNEVEFGLHLAGLRGDGNDGVVLGDHEADLAVATITTEAVVLAAPELKAVALLPIGRFAAGRFGIVHVLRGGFCDPFFGEQLLPVPFAALQVELAKLRDVLRADMQAVSTEAVALGAGVPHGAFDAERLKKARFEVIEHGLASGLRDDGGEHVAAGRVVAEKRARFLRHWMREETLHRRAGVETKLRLHLMPAAHREQVAHAHGLEVLARLRRRLIGEKLQHGIIERQFPLRDREADGGGGEALAQRPHDVALLRRLRLPPGLRDDVTVTHEHEAVQRVDLLVRRLNEVTHRSR